ncbi:MAG: carboxypeptidase M32 [Nitrososphaeria archaeon]
MRGLFTNKLVCKILEKYKLIWSIDHALALQTWDGETFMPEEGVEERGVAVSQLNLLKQKLVSDKTFVGLVDDASNETDLNDFERGIIRVLKRLIKVYLRLPPSLIEELAKTTEKSKVIWRNAKAQDNFEVFRPFLERIVELLRKKAEYLGFEGHPYDALLDLYEEGLTCNDVDRMFEALVPTIKRVLGNAVDGGKFPVEHPLERVKYDVNLMKKVNEAVVEKLGYNRTRFRMDVSAHPFTIGMGIKDVRITTRYEGKDFRSTLFSVIHEYGHALYELQNNEELAFTPLAGGVSLGVHESQSRFWENIIGRSRPFCEAIYPLLRENLEFISSFSDEDVYLYFNMVKPSLIRVDADEVTYNLHILLRYKLEKELISGEVEVRDLPELWASSMKEILGVTPKTYAEGVLQDIHWSQGDMGYFPTYTLGTVISAQLRHHILRDMPSFYANVKRLDFHLIKDWLRDKIHYWGATYSPKELLRRAVGEEIEPRHFSDYLIEKYLRDI